MSEQPELDDLLAGKEEEAPDSVPETTTRNKMANSEKISSTKKASGKSSKATLGGSKKKSEVKPDREEAAKPTVEVAAVIAAKSGEWKSVVSLWPSRLIVSGDGTPSGETYIFERAGAVVKVHPADVDFLLSKNRAKGAKDASGCCGGDGSRVYFDLA